MTSSIQGIAVDPTPPNSGEGLIFNGTAYVPTPANPGDITAVNTNLPLTGGGASGALTLDINNFTGDAGAGGLDGAVPAPAAGDAAAGKFLAAGGGWAVPPAGGGGLTLLGTAKKLANSTITGAPVDVPDMSVAFVSTGGNITVFVDMVALMGDNVSGFTRRATFYLDIDGVLVGAKGPVGQSATDNQAYWPVSFHSANNVIAAGAHTAKIICYTLGGGNNVTIIGDAEGTSVMSVWEQG